MTGRRVRYSVAASLDGFIAGPNGEYDWIPRGSVLSSHLLRHGLVDTFEVGIVPAASR